MLCDSDKLAAEQAAAKKADEEKAARDLGLSLSQIYCRTGSFVVSKITSLANGHPLFRLRPAVVLSSRPYAEPISQKII